MKNLFAIFGLLAVGAAAQDTQVTAPQKVFFFSSPVMGKPVKGAPYSATEITESSQVLGDGTHISHQSQEMVYRDGEGRVRREGPERITIFDPVAGESYTLNPKAMTAVKSAMGSMVARGGRGGAGGSTITADYGYAYTSTTSTGSTTTTGTRVNTVPSQPAESDVADQAKAAAMLDKLTAEMKIQLDDAQVRVVASKRAPAATESLGQQVIEGVTADGTRTTETIEAGSIGNDRAIQVVNERWMSADLKTPVMTKHSDPRTGEETFRLANVQRGEPGSDLFMLPPGYQIVTSGTVTKRED